MCWETGPRHSRPGLSVAVDNSDVAAAASSAAFPTLAPLRINLVPMDKNSYYITIYQDSIQCNDVSKIFYMNKMTMIA